MATSLPAASDSTTAAHDAGLVSYPFGPFRCDPQPEYVAPVVDDDSSCLESFKLAASAVRS